MINISSKHICVFIFIQLFYFRPAILPTQQFTSPKPKLSAFLSIIKQ